MKYYEDYIPENLSVYEYLVRESAGYMQLDAIHFYGKSFTYEQTMKEIDRIAEALIACGIRKNDVIASSLPGCPEGVFLIYAINKIGAIYCAFDCRSRAKEIKETLDTFKPKLCFVPSFQIKEFADIREHSIVYINITHSLNIFVKSSCFMADFFKGRIFLCMRHKNFISYDAFIKNAKNQEVLITEKSTDNIFGYFYTSGTTYGRKSIILTNENINSAVYQQKLANPRAVPGDIFMNIMPLFTCYSVSLALHSPLSIGVCVEIIPLLKPKHLKKVLLNKKPNFLATVPAHWEPFITEDFTNCNLSFIKAVAVGGDVLKSESKKLLNEIFEKCGCPNALVIGYGLSETTSTTTTGMHNTPHDSVGRPFINTLIQICDPETMRPLSPYEKGEICIYGPTVCKGYYKDPEMTNALLKIHDDGKVWLHSGDCGYVDESGAVYFCERYKRMYVRFDGSKISPFDIEQKLNRCSVIDSCMVVSIQDKQHSHGKCAKALIVLKDNSNEKNARKAIEKFIHNELDEHMIPQEIVFVKHLPYTKNGKLDYFGA